MELSPILCVKKEIDIQKISTMFYMEKSNSMFHSLNPITCSVFSNMFPSITYYALKRD